MAEKMSTIVMRVDLDCDRCYKKIRKVLCKLQDRASIKTISYDERGKTVTVSGPFDADEVSDKLCSDAGKVITDIHVVSGNARPGAAKAPKPGKASNNGGGGGVGGGGNGGKPKPEKKHVKFDMDDDEDAIDMHAHHHAGNGKPRVVSATNAAAASRLEAPRADPRPPVPMSMMASMAAPPAMVPQAMAVPSIWPAPAAPEWGYSAPAYGGGGYYGGAAHDHGAGGYGPYGYGRNPYQPQPQPQPQYYYEEPSAGCRVM